MRRPRLAEEYFERNKGAFWDLREEVLQLERALLCALRFDLRVENPYMWVPPPCHTRPARPAVPPSCSHTSAPAPPPLSSSARSASQLHPAQTPHRPARGPEGADRARRPGAGRHGGGGGGAGLHEETAAVLLELCERHPAPAKAAILLVHRQGGCLCVSSCCLGSAVKRTLRSTHWSREPRVVQLSLSTLFCRVRSVAWRPNERNLICT